MENRQELLEFSNSTVIPWHSYSNSFKNLSPSLALRSLIKTFFFCYSIVDIKKEHLERCIFTPPISLKINRLLFSEMKAYATFENCLIDSALFHHCEVGLNVFPSPKDFLLLSYKVLISVFHYSFWSISKHHHHFESRESSIKMRSLTSSPSSFLSLHVQI